MTGRFKGWDHVRIVDDGGILRDALAPVIISASRSTDIPAFFGEWFMHRLDREYAAWINPWNGRKFYVSFAKTRAIVFWSKNPEPFIRFLPLLDEKKIPYYFLYTLNDYAPEGLEPGIPSLADRVNTFIQVSEMVGKGRVVWRCDPLLLSDTLSIDDLLSRIQRIGSRLHHHTRRMVMSFIDIAKYPRVRKNLERAGNPGVREFSRDEMIGFCRGLRELNAGWGLSLSACGEEEDLSVYGIARGQCISGSLMKEEFPDDEALMGFLGDPGPVQGSGRRSIPFRNLKDPGQRGACGCIASKDIGQYSTCMHHCRYCYANAGTLPVVDNYARYLERAQAGVFPDTITGRREEI